MSTLIVAIRVSLVTLVLTGLLTATSSIFDIVWRLLVIGFGQALFQAPNNSALMGSAPPQDRGLAAGFLATGRVIGQSLSVALAGAVFTGFGGALAGAALEKAVGAGLNLQGTFLGAFRTALFVCAGVAAVGVGASLVRGADERGAQERRARKQNSHTLTKQE